jgi:hypothetical protein
MAGFWDRLIHKPIDDLLMGVLLILLLPFVWYYLMQWLKAVKEEKEYRNSKDAREEDESSHKEKA